MEEMSSEREHRGETGSGNTEKVQAMQKDRRNIIRITGAVFVSMGIALMLAGLCLFLWNRREDELAGRRAQETLAEVKAAMEAGAALSEQWGDSAASLAEGDPAIGSGRNAEGGTGEQGTDIPTVTVGAYEYAGYLCIPALGLELPVMAQWSYPRLKAAPCRYYGTAREGNLVIAAHNYPRHFGRLSKLSQGAEITYTDAEGTVWRYEVETTDVLAPEAVEEMTEAGYALTLFTCTYGGASRVTVRCRVQE